jgi:murein DD-endopeptidase MepM/ murein hydrolase activator NlpD
MAILRQSGQPVDLYAALPKVGQIAPRNFQDSFDERQNLIADRGPVATAYVQQRAAARQQAAFANLQQNFQQRFNNLGQAGAAPSGNGGAPQPNGKFWMNPTGKYKPEFAYGNYPSGGEHDAYDFGTPYGSKIYAPTGGTIVSAGKEKGGFGTAIRIKFDNGVFGIMGHLSKVIGLKPGMIITPGQLLALSGNSGNSTGPHFHFETRYDLYKPSTAFDPAKYFGWK